MNFFWCWFTCCLYLKRCGMFSYWIDKFQTSGIVYAWNTSEYVFSSYILCKHILSCQKDQKFSLGSIEHTAHACLNTQFVFVHLLYSAQNSLVIYHHDCSYTVHSMLSHIPMPSGFSSSLSARHQFTIFHFQSSVSSRQKPPQRRKQLSSMWHTQSSGWHWTRLSSAKWASMRELWTLKWQELTWGLLKLNAWAGAE